MSDTSYPVVTDPLTGQVVINMMSSSSKTLSLPLMPTRAQVDSYINEGIAAIKSGMSTAS